MTNFARNSTTSIFNQAFVLYGKSQVEFGRLIGKNQSQVSKYLNGQVAPPAESIIQCMNIIYSKGDVAIDCPHTLGLINKIRGLQGEKYRALRLALEAMITAAFEEK